MLPNLRKIFVYSSQKIFQKNLGNLAKFFNDSHSLEHTIPREFFSQSHLLQITKDLNYANNSQDIKNLTKGLSEPTYDLLDRGGKRLRPIICFFIAQCFNADPKDVLDIAALVELVHHATLMVDDIEDNSKVRRNKPCVHLLFGTDIAINTGNFLYFAPIKQLLENPKYTDTQKLKFSQNYINEMTHLHLGQNWDISWHNNNKNNMIIKSQQGEEIINIQNLPTEEQYLQMAAHKTGVLCRMAVKLVFETCISLNVTEGILKILSDYIEGLGIAFQIQDDILNLVGEKYSKTKGQVGEDIHEGKLSLIVLHSLRHLNPQDSVRLMKILCMKTNDQNLINEAIQLVQKSKSIEYAKIVSEKLITQSWDKVSSILPENEGKQQLRQLGEYVIGREM